MKVEETPMGCANRVCVAAIMVWTAATPFCAGRTVPTKPRHHPPAVLELLDKHAQNQDKLKSYIIKSETYYPGKTTTLLNGRKVPNKGIPPPTVEKRSDGAKFYICEQDPTALGASATGVIPGDLKSRTWVWDGNLFYFYGSHSEKFVKQHAQKLSDRDYKYREQAVKRMRGNAVIYADTADPRIKKMISQRRPATMMPGLGIHSMLRKAERLSLRPEIEVLNGSQCRIVEAQIGQENYKVWIDPAHGYNVAKMIWWRAGKKQLVEWNTVFKLFDGAWLPVESNFQYSNTGGRLSEDIHQIKVTQVILNPDHDALKSFVPKPKEGSVVCIRGCADIDEKREYIWKDERVVDDSSRVIEGFRKKADKVRKQDNGNPKR